MASKEEEIYPDVRESDHRTRNDSFCSLLLRFLVIYWKSLITVIWPLILLPVFIYNNTEMYRCFYVIVVMGVFWVTEALPLPITSLIPIVLYPMMNILDTSETCDCYMNDTTLMFIGSLVIALAIENSGLHLRVALLIIRLIGCSHRKLSLGLFCVTMFISMWISNTAATAMMIPIIETVLVELEAQGLGKMFITENDASEEEGVQSTKRPTHSTLMYYLAAAYASSIGGTGTIVGTGTNLAFKGIYEKRFPNSPGLNFTMWMLYAVPVMIVMGLLIWLWLQIMYMGLFRPGSKDARAIDVGQEGERIAKTVIEKRYKELGPITWHETSVGMLFIIVILLWFFREPGFIAGWPSYITNSKVKDSTPAIFLTIVFFVLPAKLDFLQSFSKNPSKRPTKPSPGLISWKIIHDKMHWSLLLLFGGGFAIAAGSTASGLSSALGNSLIGLKSMNSIAILFIVCFFAEYVTELTSNVAVANIILPVIAEMSVAIHIHPLYLMMPAAMCCSFSFHLPVGTPPNAISSAAGHIKARDFIIGGIGPSIITLAITTIAFPTWGSYVFELSKFPDWIAS